MDETIKNTSREWFNPKSWFRYDTIVKNLSYILFLGLLAIVYIWNSHSAERQVQEMNKLQDQMDERYWEFVTAKSELNQRSKRSEVSRMVEAMGLQDEGSQPLVIEITE